MQLPAVAARSCDRTSNENAAASADGWPTISAMRGIAPPTAEGPVQMRTADPMITIAPPRRARVIARTLLLAATVRNDRPRITATGSETPEWSKTLDMSSCGTT